MTTDFSMHYIRTLEGAPHLKNTNPCEIHEGSRQLNFVPTRSLILVSISFLRYEWSKVFTVAAISKSSKNYTFLNIYQTLWKVLVKKFNLLKKRLWRRCFPVTFAKFLSTPFLQNTSGGCFLSPWLIQFCLFHMSCRQACSDRRKDVQDTLKAFHNFKNKQQKCEK